METSNSEVRFYRTLQSRLMADVAVTSGLYRNRQLKFDTLYSERRTDREGFVFLTKMLPALGKSVDTALGRGVPLIVPAGFKLRRNSALPRFLGALLEHIFDEATGLELDFVHDPSGALRPVGELMELEAKAASALKHFRQVVYLTYKLELEFEKDSVEKLLSSFQTVDESLPGAAFMVQTADTAETLKVAAEIAATVFGSLDVWDITPAHGPGSVATGEVGREKTQFSRIYEAIERVYPFTEYYMFNANHVVADYRYLENLESLSSGTAKVVLVPKDSRGPRLISCEPLEYQWIQQGLGRAIMARLERNRLTRGFVNFTDQYVNRDLAMLGSSDDQVVRHPHTSALCKRFGGADWITLDMKEASDRVSLDLVKQVFRHTPTLLEALLATRSTATILPSGQTITLKKFAPMGSALCFPVEAFVFWALAVGAIVTRELRGRRQSWLARGRAIKRAARMVYVYGDDIIIKREDYALMASTYPEFGLMLNEGKCCTAGSFRESCGCDAYRGIDVTPTRLRAVWCNLRQNSPEVLFAYVAFTNAMELKGYIGVADYVHSWINRVYGSLPTSLAIERKPYLETVVGTSGQYAGLQMRLPQVGQLIDASGLVYYTNDATKLDRNAYIRSRLNKSLFRREYHTLGVYSKPEDALPPREGHSGYDEVLHRTNCGLGSSKGKYAVRHCSRLKRRWVSIIDDHATFRPVRAEEYRVWSRRIDGRP